MPQEIKTIRLSLPFRLGSVNCYLINTGDGFVLIDTGSLNQRARLEDELQSAGCRPGNLKLVVITHGDFDHTGNSAYLRTKYDAKIAMHAGDAGMAERGDMFWNRKKGNALIRALAPVLFGFNQSVRFKPDILIEDDVSLSGYGFDAIVYSIPGHSLGSIGILADGGNLFCGDLFVNTAGPAFSSIMDDLTMARASLEKLKKLAIHTVYPGHGASFSWQDLLDRMNHTNRA
ncbi:MAG: MBL fold metallo-hydrolase [Omnitrophica WOR_2 bacterium]